MRSTFLPFICALSVSLFLTACGPSNNIHLLNPKPSPTAVLPAPGVHTISVVRFADKRAEHQTIGVRRDGSAFTTQDDTAGWVSKALADEIAKSGLAVSYAQNFEQARRGNPDFIVMGNLTQALLKEKSATSMETAFNATYTLANRQKKLINNASASACQSRTGLPTNSAAEGLLRATMLDLVQEMSQKIVATIGLR